MKRLLPISAAIIVVLLAGGCPTVWNTKSSDESPSAEKLFQRAEKLYREKSYREAAKLYDSLKSAHPEFDQLPKVYQRIADAFYALGDYEEAIARYQQFLELYPRHPWRYRTLYQIGMCYYKRIEGIDRDDTMVRKAADQFQKLASDPDGGEWKDKAEEKYRICRKKMAEKELYKARTYISLSNYKAARIAARRVLKEYSGLGLDKEAQELIDSIKGK